MLVATIATMVTRGIGSQRAAIAIRGTIRTSGTMATVGEAMAPADLAALTGVVDRATGNPRHSEAARHHLRARAIPLTPRGATMADTPGEVTVGARTGEGR